MLTRVKDNKGFTLIELMMVMVMAAILLQMAWSFAGDLRKRGADVAAVADGRNLITVVRTNFVNLDSVNYNATEERNIGVTRREGGDRPPVFTLSRGVMARIEAGSESGVANQGYFEAFIFHTNGSGDETPSGKKEFWYLADEANDVYSLPLF